MTYMPIEEAQLWEAARDLVQHYKVHHSDYSQLIDNYAEVLIYISDNNLGKAIKVVRTLDHLSNVLHKNYHSQIIEHQIKKRKWTKKKPLLPKG